MADAKAAQQAAPTPTPEVSGGGSHGQKPTLFIILAVVNMFFVMAVGTMLYLGEKKKAAEPGLDHVIKGEAETQKVVEEQKEFIGKVVPLETFLVNLSDSRGRKLAKINLELEVSNNDVQEEIEKLKPKVRDIIIIILSGKSYQQISNKEGKDALRDEIRDQVNLFLTKGQIKKVYFTEFIFN